MSWARAKPLKMTKCGGRTGVVLHPQPESYPLLLAAGRGRQDLSVSESSCADWETEVQTWERDSN